MLQRRDLGDLLALELDLVGEVRPGRASAFALQRVSPNA
jgi:hypothetical protein